MTDYDGLVHDVIRLALDNVRDGGRPYAAVVLSDGEVVGTGVNSVIRDQDPTGHAEVNAVRDACRTLSVERLDSAEMVSSCRPCRLCLATLSLVRLARVRYAGESDSGIEVLWPDVELVFHPSADAAAPFALTRRLDADNSRMLGGW